MQEYNKRVISYELDQVKLPSSSQENAKCVWQFATEEKLMDLNGCISLAQSYLQNSPLIVLGSGASIPYGLPSMDTLASKICRELSDTEDDG